MWFKKKNIDLFNHKLITEIELKISDFLNISIVSKYEILEKLSLDELNLSQISKTELLSIFKNENAELTKFICLTYSLEKKHEENLNLNKTEKGKTKGLSKGFSITYAIYYYFIKNNKKTELKTFLEKRKIPKHQEFIERLEQYFTQFEGVSLSDSYLQYASGFEKDDINQTDISKAIKDLQNMDDEHGAFWISVTANDYEEFVIEVNKEMKLTLIIDDKESYIDCYNWLEVENIFNLQIEKKFKEIISKIKK